MISHVARGLGLCAWVVGYRRQDSNVLDDLWYVVDTGKRAPVPLPP